MEQPRSIVDPAGIPLRFSWDRDETGESLAAKLAEATPQRWLELASWIMREARIDEVWGFLSLGEIAKHFGKLEPRLGRRRKLWNYLMNTWREMGRI